MSSFWTSFALIARRGYMTLVFSKKTLFFLAGCGLYAFAIAMLFWHQGDQKDLNSLFSMPSLFFLIEILAPLTSLYYAISAIRDEISERTIVHLLSAPVPRASIWLGKFAASTAASITVLAIGLTAASLAAGFVPTDPAPGEELRGATVTAFYISGLLAPFAYCAVGTFLSVFFKRAMIAGAVFVFVWELSVGSFPVGAAARKLTVVDSVRTVLYHEVGDAGRLHRFLERWQAAGSISRDRESDMRTLGSAYEALGWFVVVSLALAVFVGQRRDFESAPKE